MIEYQEASTVLSKEKAAEEIIRHPLKDRLNDFELIQVWNERNDNYIPNMTAIIH